MISFCEFANKLLPIISDGCKRYEFVTLLFDKILLLEEGDPDDVNPFADKNATTLRRYINQNDPRDLPAEEIQKIRKYIDGTVFATFISTFPDNISQQLADEFFDVIPGINKKNVATCLGDAFEAILFSILGPEEEPTEFVPAIVKPVPSEIVKLHGPKLLFETDRLCPCTGCTHSLTATAPDGSTQYLYQVTRIDPKGDVSYDNLIALCPACYSRHTSMCSQSAIDSLKKKKQAMCASNSLRDRFSEQQIEQGIDRLLRKITEMTDTEVQKHRASYELNYDPEVVARKIPGTSLELRRLRNRIVEDVSEYYPAVDTVLAQLNREGVIRQRLFANQIHGLFLSLDDGQTSKREIFNGIVDWLHTGTNEDIDFCHVVAAYFVQSCEVFDVIPQ